MTERERLMVFELAELAYAMLGMAIQARLRARDPLQEVQADIDRYHAVGKRLCTGLGLVTEKEDPEHA